MGDSTCQGRFALPGSSGRARRRPRGRVGLARDGRRAEVGRGGPAPLPGRPPPMASPAPSGRSSSAAIPKHEPHPPCCDQLWRDWRATAAPGPQRHDDWRGVQAKTGSVVPVGRLRARLHGDQVTGLPLRADDLQQRACLGHVDRMRKGPEGPADRLDGNHSHEQAGDQRTDGHPTTGRAREQVDRRCHEQQDHGDQEQREAPVQGYFLATAAATASGSGASSRVARTTRRRLTASTPARHATAATPGSENPRLLASTRSDAVPSQVRSDPGANGRGATRPASTRARLRRWRARGAAGNTRR